jgi:hypothetical protein
MDPLFHILIYILITMLHIGQQIKAFYIITINNNPGKSTKV